MLRNYSSKSSSLRHPTASTIPSSGRLARIISGGQTGADQGALAAARQLRLPTGGWMPQGFMTEAGPRPDFATLHRMREHSEAGSQARTKANVCDADGTLIIGDISSGGSRGTKEFCAKHAKPCHVIPWRSGDPVPLHAAPEVRDWLARYDIRVLNIAGNRESEEPGIHDAVLAFLVQCLTGWNG